MGFFERLKRGLSKTQTNLYQEIKRIFTLSPRLTKDSAEELEAALLSADLGVAVTQRILAAVKYDYESQGRKGLEVFEIAKREIETALKGLDFDLVQQAEGTTVISLVGVNGTGKTTTCAKLAHRLQSAGHQVWLGACDTFRAAAIDQLKRWSERLQIPITTGRTGSDAASVAHEAVVSATAKQADYLLLDTAGRLHTHHNLMRELEKIHRVAGKKLPGSPHEVLLTLDATTGMNAINQVGSFNKATPLTGLVVTKLDGTSRGGVVVAIQEKFGIPVKFMGVGEQPDDLQPFEVGNFAQALFEKPASS